MPRVKFKHKSCFHLVIGLMACLNFFATVAVGQYYFGRNKINYAKFDWFVLNSAHFNIYYYKGEEEIAAMAQEIAEEAFSEYEVKFNITIDRPIPLIIYSNPIHFQQTNVIPELLPEGVGGFFEYRKGRVVLPFSGNRRDFYHVVRHELVHVFTHYKISNAARKIGLMTGIQFPLWFFEGLAEYWSIGYDSEAEMFMRDAILHEYYLPLSSNELYFSGFLLYKEGQAFFKYFCNQFGEERLRRLMANHWMYDSFEQAIHAICGKSFKEIEADWKLSLKKQFATALSEKDLARRPINKKLRRHIQVSPALIPNDSTHALVYMSNHWGYENIVVDSANSQKIDILIRDNSDPRFESLHLLQTRLSVNPRGELAFVAKAEGKDYLWIYNIKRQKVAKCISSPALITLRSPAWNAAGNMIAFSAQDTSGRSDIYLWLKDSDSILRLTDDIYGDSFPSFSPDSRYIAFSSDRGDAAVTTREDIFVYDLNSGDIVQVTNSPYRETRPFWHPSHQDVIYFLSDRAGTDNLWAVELENGIPKSDMRATYFQISDYYSGINDFAPRADSSVILSQFSQYSFHLNKFSVALKAPSDSALIKQCQPAPQVPTRSQAHKSRAKSYKLKYSLDFAQSFVAYDPIFGRFGGAQLGVSDMLGDRYLNFLIANSAVSVSGFRNYWNFAATMVDIRQRSNRAFGVFHFANDWYSPYEGFFYERNVGIRTAVNYPINLYNRLELSASTWYSRREYFDSSYDRFLLANFISFVHDNALWLPTGPIDGWRMRLSIGPSFDILSSQINNYTFLGDFRYYLRLGESVCLAQRAMGFINEGKNIYRYYIGGSWYLRGYRRTEVFGKKFILFNTELRFPIAQGLLLHFRQGAIGFAPIRGAMFFDAGNAWDRNFPGLIGSFGIGLRAPFMNAIVLRLDIGKQTDFKTIKDPTFVQFLFGWDF